MKFFRENKVTIFYFAAIVAVTTLLIVFYLNSIELKRGRLLVDDTQEVIAKSDAVLLDVLNIETGTRGFLLTGNEAFLGPLRSSENTLDGNIDILSSLTKDNTSQIGHVDSLKRMVEQRLILSKEKIQIWKSNRSNQEILETYLTRANALTAKIRLTIATINNEEFALLKKRKIANEKNLMQTQISLLLLLLVTGVIFSILIFMRREQNYRSREIERISELQKSLSHYSRSLLEASLDPLIIISTEGRISDVNNATIKMTGLKRKELIGSEFSSHFTQSKKALSGYRKAYEEGLIMDFPLTIKHTNGSLTDVMFNASVYKDDNGEVLGISAAARDVTLQKRISKELIEARTHAYQAADVAENAQIKAEKATEIAEDAVKTKQVFLGNMSHEIRTPMNAIIGFTKVMLKTDLDAKQKEYLEAIKQSGDSLILLINDILDLSKIDAGKVAFENIPFKLKASIFAMAHVFEAKISEKNLTLDIDYDDQIPQVLLGDPLRLRQIILNLLSNAVKFTKQGKITVKVLLLQKDNNLEENQVKLEFTVADTGIGIAKDSIGKIFENFQQASTGTSRLYGGTGLGLAIVKQLVEAQNGSIEVISRENEGSSFSFNLKFEKTNKIVEYHDELLEINKDFKHIKVLIVEDMALNQLLMKTLLDDFGFERDIAENGLVAIEKMLEKEYDIVLMDLQMPEMNGYEATEYIRNKMHSNIPIIALTADVTTTDLARCKSAGMNDYIAKPVDERILYTKIIELVKKPSHKTFKSENENTTQDHKKLKCTDLSYLAGITKNDPELMREMISLYLKQTPLLVSKMRQSLFDKDWDIFKSAAHKIAPSFAIVGIDSSYRDVVKKMQAYSGQLSKFQEMEGLLTQVENICAQACEELENEIVYQS